MAGSNEKTAARQRFKAYRSSLTKSEYERHSSKICSHLESLRTWIPGEVVHVFWPMIERREPDIRPFIQILFELPVRLVMPVVSSYSADPVNGGRLRHARVNSLQNFRHNKWGIAEPDCESFVSENELDVIIAPGLGADRNGHRMGYGMGYYDEFLSLVDIPTICPIFSACLVDKIPREKHDVAISVIVTEQGVVEIDKT
ncbi:MAG: 5-formyltetrahydrofolate cyclo-ligase [Rhodothermia bacterium]|nr:MAG: 5-formyltetrahydrofolate cyclo-ligase [Rhodothermia bacterium]